MKLRDDTIKSILERNPGLVDDLDLDEDEKALARGMVESTVEFCIAKLWKSSGKAVITEDQVVSHVESIMPELKALLLVFIEGLKVSCEVVGSKAC